MAAVGALATIPPTAIPVALPDIHADLDASVAELQWSVTAYTLAFSAFLIVAGRLADAFGRRRALFVGSVLYAGGSVVAALAGGAWVLILGSTVAGLGAAAIIPASLAIVVSSYSPERRGLPIGLWGAGTFFGQGIGPIVGGALAGTLGWRYLFWFGAVCAALLIAACIWTTAESLDRGADRRIDAIGLGAAVGALVTLSLAVIQGPIWGFGSAQTVILFVTAAILAALFLLIERRALSPLVDLSFFARRNFSGATAVLFAVNFALIVPFFLLPLMLQQQLDYTATEAGALLAPLTAGLVLLMPLGGPAASRLGPLPPIAVGLTAMAAGLLLLSSVDADSTYAELWGPMALCGAGAGLAVTPMNVAAMSAIPSRQSGAAGGVFTTLSGLGMAFGVAVAGTVFHARQLAETRSLTADGGVQLSASQAAELEGLLADVPGAQRTLGELSRGARRTVQEAVPEAFTSAIGAGFLVGAMVAIAGLVLALGLVRRRPPADLGGDG